MDMFDGVGRRSAEKTGRFLNIGQHSLNGYERDLLFRNNGDGTFTDVAFVNAADRIEDGRGLSIADLDRESLAAARPGRLALEPGRDRRARARVRGRPLADARGARRLRLSVAAEPGPALRPG